MSTAFKTDMKLKTFCISKNYPLRREKEISLINIKFYQKLFVVLLALSTFLILPESPRELANICESYNSHKICDVW